MVWYKNFLLCYTLLNFDFYPRTLFYTFARRLQSKNYIIGSTVKSPRYFLQKIAQVSNLWWMPNLASKVFCTAIGTGPSRRFQQYPTTSCNSASLSSKFGWGRISFKARKGSWATGCCWNRLDEPVLMIGPSHLLSELGIQCRLKICGGIW